jgi:hypothetical protein
MLLFKLGYPELSDGRSFTILIDRKGAEPLRKQVDVFGKDDETVVVAECKASAKLTRRTLQKDIEEFANLKGPISSAVRSHYGTAVKLKIIWLFVTENIIWSTPDKQRALGENIQIITERELRYYAQIAEHLGKAARYQFLAEFLKDQPIPELKGKTVPATKGKLGGKPFYCFVTTPRHLLKISFVNHRSLNDPEGAPTYQRLVSRSRLRDIGEFIKGGGYFPNNLIINFTGTCSGIPSPAVCNVTGFGNTWTAAIQTNTLAMGNYSFSIGLSNGVVTRSASAQLNIGDFNV